MTHKKRIAFLLKTLEVGGIERVVLNLLGALAKRQDIQLDLVVAQAKGGFLEQVPSNVRVIDLNTCIENRTRSLVKAVPAIAGYLRREKPDVLLAHLPIVNVLASIAKTLARSPVRLILVEHTLPFNRLVQVETAANPNAKSPTHNTPDLLTTLLPLMMRGWYPRAHAVVTVSHGMAQELETALSMKSGSVQVIYNPVVDDSLLQKSRSAPDHPWLQPEQPPVFIAVGRLTVQKDYPTLIHAFAKLRQQESARLIILGEGESRSELESLIHQLDLTADVSLPSVTHNPYAYMSHASVLVLSSKWEGLPTVLIEAMACGCQVVSTNCPHGPSEILDQGKYGWLVPVEDPSSLASAMKAALHNSMDPEKLTRRANDFGLAQAIANYLAIMSLE
ncbi:MAG: glycosyltransferase [Leptolyngbyaceae cyanobacterium MO_188.B28]|nr:glycosyltransferase [Leptolyngbyaceae cyanobacterium MO_188.B28]